MRGFILIVVCILLWSNQGFAEKKPSLPLKSSASEGEAPVLLEKSADFESAIILPGDSTLQDSKKKKNEKPTFYPGIPFLTILTGLIALASGAFNPIGILIAGGIFVLIGISLLLFYKKLKGVNPLKLPGNNVVAKIIFALLLFMLLITVIAAIVIAFVVALALLITALLSSVISPVVVAGCIIGLGVLGLLISVLVYWIRYRRYKRSLK